MADIPFLGCKISLISKCDIRYEGILYCVDAKESTIALSKVKSYGTETRGDPNCFVAPKNDIYDIIIFRASDVKDLRVDAQQPPGLSDPAIISVNNHKYTGQSPSTSSFINPNSSNNSTSNANRERVRRDDRPRDDRQDDRRDDRRGERQDDRRSDRPDDRRVERRHERQGDRRDDRQVERRDDRQVDRRDDRRGGSRERRDDGLRRDGRSNMRMSRGNNRNHLHANTRYNNNSNTNNYNRRGSNNRDNNSKGGAPNYRRGPPPGVRRGRSGDRTGAPRGTRKTAPLKFEGEYDFEKANKIFLDLEGKLKNMKLKDDKEGPESSGERADSKSPAPQSESGSGYDSEDQIKDGDSKGERASVSGDFYDKTKSFFDNISCEASERSQGKVNKPNWRKERELNTETFGVSGNYRRGGYRGRGYGANGYHRR